MDNGTHIETSDIKWYDRKRAVQVNKANLIEDFIANDMSFKELAKKYEITANYACRIVQLYFKKPKSTITLQSAV